MQESPIVFDPEIRAILNSPGPSLADFERMPSRRVVDSEDGGHVETLDDLIAVLEGMRERFGGDATVEDDECGLSIHIFATEYGDGETVVRL